MLLLCALTLSLACCAVALVGRGNRVLALSVSKVGWIRGPSHNHILSWVDQKHLHDPGIYPLFKDQKDTNGFILKTKIDGTIHMVCSGHEDLLVYLQAESNGEYVLTMDNRDCLVFIPGHPFFPVQYLCIDPETGAHSLVSAKWIAPICLHRDPLYLSRDSDVPLATLGLKLLDLWTGRSLRLSPSHLPWEPAVQLLPATQNDRATSFSWKNSLSAAVIWINTQKIPDLLLLDDRTLKYYLAGPLLKRISDIDISELLIPDSLPSHRASNGRYICVKLEAPLIFSTTSLQSSATLFQRICPNIEAILLPGQESWSIIIHDGKHWWHIHDLVESKINGQWNHKAAPHSDA